MGETGFAVFCWSVARSRRAHRRGGHGQHPKARCSQAFWGREACSSERGSQSAARARALGCSARVRTAPSPAPGKRRRAPASRVVRQRPGLQRGYRPPFRWRWRLARVHARAHSVLPISPLAHPAVDACLSEQSGSFAGGLRAGAGNTRPNAQSGTRVPGLRAQTGRSRSLGAARGLLTVQAADHAEGSIDELNPSRKPASSAPKGHFATGCM